MTVLGNLGQAAVNATSISSTQRRGNWTLDQGADSGKGEET